MSCRHHSSKTQSLVPVPVLRDARVTYILLPLLILVTSLSRTSLIGLDWELGFHVDMTPPQRLLHITQQNHQFIPRIMNMQFHVPVNEWTTWKTFYLFKDFILLLIWTENVILFEEWSKFDIYVPKALFKAMFTNKRTMSWMKLFCC